MDADDRDSLTDVEVHVSVKNTFVFLPDSEDAAASKEENFIDSLPKHEDIEKRDQLEKGKKGKKEKTLKSKGAEKGVESTGVIPTIQETQVLPERKGGPQQKLLVKPGGLWYDVVSTAYKVMTGLTFYSCTVYPC